ncbi:putative Two-component hybrid protein, sensory box hisitidine kinase/adenylate cyclase [Candidatus Terasakiella magnetica]|uniref:guanylate cyclase n=1 Tax=Candidatus Terasakiella magnetica TaxID=1867952 RepID=A0A1C3RFV8_9PROT|nr:adenylate/guanylate cyclase domain-containing protein [Candidatus Terasakiella magnetica]SCA56138.1 putative Two-component hybrid protein, sensory box hisitidine kinase/adenylate cyclase [Candidatus Terasakiella magnetica]
MKYPVPENEAKRNEAVRAYRVMDSPPEIFFDEIGNLAAQICECPVSYVSFIEDDRFWFKSKYGLPDDFEGCPREIAFCSITVCGSELILSPDLTQDDRFKDFHFVVNDPHFKFYCAMPLVTPDGYSIGTICVMDFEPRELTFKQTDAVRRLALQLTTQLEHRRRLLEIDESMRELDEAHSQLAKEKNRADNLLSSMLPQTIAQELIETGSVAPKFYPDSSILFADVVGFTQFVETAEPAMLIGMLNTYFARFDEIISQHGLEKVKTIGDAYMAVAGVPTMDRLHVLNACLSALSILQAVDKIASERKRLHLPVFEFRLGLHCGPVIAGLVGNQRATYDIWGDAVNTAARLESCSQAGRINVCKNIYHQMAPYFEFTGQGMVEAKHKEPMEMYFLDRLKADFSEDPQGYVPNQHLQEALNPSMKIVMAPLD